MDITSQRIWAEYERGKDYLNKFNYYSNTEECTRFYNGDQWRGLKTGGERIPQLNMIQPIVDYKVATVNSNGYAISYRSMGVDMKFIEESKICDRLNTLADSEWERLKLDNKIWKHTLKAAVTGDSYVFFFWNSDKGYLQEQTIPNVNIHFADEQEDDIQKQKYIIIVERMLVSKVKSVAEENGIDKDNISLITPDTFYDKEIGDKAKKEVEQEDNDGKCIVLTRLWKEDGVVHFCKSTKDVIILHDYAVNNLSLYPIAHLRWKEEQGSARGLGEVLHLIPNQIEINKSLARHAMIIKNFAFPHIVYNAGKISREGINNLSKVGSVIGTTENATEAINNYISYLSPPVIPNDSINLSNQLISLTRELSGASEAFSGQINPEKASGAAITAVQDAQALPLSIQESNLKQFIEDIARIWLDMWKAYNPNGLTIGVKDKLNPVDEYGNRLNPVDVVIGVEIDGQTLSKLDLSVKIDVSPKNPYSKYSQEQNLQNFMANGYISFEEYVNALDDDSSIPKAKLLSIIERQKEQQKEMQERQEIINEQINHKAINEENGSVAIEDVMAENQALLEKINELTEKLNGSDK